MSKWAIVPGGGRAHVTPIDDLVEHDLVETCVCGPADELVHAAAGDRWVVVHQALDGRP